MDHFSKRGTPNKVLVWLVKAQRFLQSWQLGGTISFSPWKRNIELGIGAQGCVNILDIHLVIGAQQKQE